MRISARKRPWAVTLARLLAWLSPGPPALDRSPRRRQGRALALDWAYYNPVSLVLKDKGWIEEEFAADGIEVTWVQSPARTRPSSSSTPSGIQFGSTAGAAALLARVNDSPIRSVYVYSRPEWTALVTRPDTGIAKVEDLAGKRVAVTRGTDPYIFLLRALAAARPDREGHRAGAAAARRWPRSPRGRPGRRLGRARPDDGADRAREGLAAVLPQSRGQHLGRAQRPRRASPPSTPRSSSG